MKLKEYLAKLNQLVEENPSLLDADVIYSSDDEGNSYQPVNYEPSKGAFDGENFDPTGEDGQPVVCLN